MNIFRTELMPTPSGVKISLHSPLMTIGSCFSDSIGNMLNENKFEVLTNPFGNVYNPVSIHEILDRAIVRTYPERTSYLQHKGTFFNFHFHSKFHSAGEDDLARQIKAAIDASHDFIGKVKVLIITYGTSYV